MSFSVRDNGLWFGAKRLGPRDGLFVDSSELKGLGEADGVRHLVTPGRIDMLFVAGTRVVGVESKMPDDLASSVRGKRLARQMRTLLGQVDVVALLLRWFSGARYDEDVLDELVRLQALGVVLLPGASLDSDVPRQLARWRPILADGSRAALVAIAGTDRRPVREPYGDGRFLLNVKGIGTVQLAKLRKRFGSTADVLAAGPEAWRAAGVSAAIVRRLGEAAS